MNLYWALLDDRKEEALAMLLRLAAADNPFAQAEVIRRLELREKIPGDDHDAHYWLDCLTAQGERGDTAVQMLLFYYWRDHGRRREEKERMAYWLRKAAEAGNADAQYQMWQEAEVVFGSPRSKAEAAAQPWLEKSAAQEFPDALWCLSWSHFTPDGEPTAKALELIERAAALDQPSARQFLGRRKAKWRGAGIAPTGATCEVRESAEYQQAIEQWDGRRDDVVARMRHLADADDPDALAFLADRAKESDDRVRYQSLIGRLTELAEAGNVNAQKRLVHQVSDRDGEAYWRLRAAASGDPESQYGIWAYADLVFPGPRDLAKKQAQPWLEASAAQGYEEALWVLSFQYFEDSRPTARAMELLKQAAAQKFPPALDYLEWLKRQPEATRLRL